MLAHVFLFAFFCSSWMASALPDVVQIAGIFGEGDEQIEMAFRYAVRYINEEVKIKPRTRLRAITINLPAEDSFMASRLVCGTLNASVAGIFGPQSANVANHVQSICDAYEIPHIEARWDYKRTRDAYSINLYPHPKSLGEAYYDVLRYLEWEKFVILYENNESLVRLQQLLQGKHWEVHVRHLEGQDYRPLLKQIKKAQFNRIVLDVPEDRIYSVLEQAAQIGLMREYYSYFITSLDLHRVKLDEFRYVGPNITSLRLLDPKDTKVRMRVEKWQFGERLRGKMVDFDNFKIKTEAALMFDAVHFFAAALGDLDRSHDIRMNPLSCDTEYSWPHGNSLINYMKYYGVDPKVESYVLGLTGKIKFDREGFRTDFMLDILELTREVGLKKVGVWTKAGGANYTRSNVEVTQQVIESLKNRTLRVTTAISAPYTMLKDSSESLRGNDKYEGFCVDLIDAIAKSRGFNYTFYLVPDKAYGSKDKVTGQWDGMVRELLEHRADLGIVDFTITYEREEAIDFSMPFMNLGISIIYKKPQKKDPNLFSFMSPFSIDVWIYMATAYLGVSVLLFILARITPNEWDNPHPCIQDPDELENTISLDNAFWFTIGSLMQQGSDIAPKAVSTRIVAGIWWFFTLIMISSYTANLAAFLTVERMDSPIESAEDLAKQTKIKYGCKLDGSTYGFFRGSNIPTYQRMWAAMSNARPPVFTNTNDEGVDRVSKSGGMYAFLMESSSIEYVIERRCDLMQVGGLLDSKSYGIALPPDSPYTGAISSAILQLKENGTLHDLKKKWWERRKGGGHCTQEQSAKQSSAAAELGLANVGGVFVVLIGGMGLATIVAICEFIWNARELATDENASFCEELGTEVSFILKCSGNTKPVRKKYPSTPEEQLFTYGSYGASYGYSNKK
ncbi:glutamate receptor ionotropic, kainate 2-like isoform X2 [Oratosquilla oratoria]|uniref:glutamate receptor ionotropic, kainate 2-like isoform X2 n=1 Tax=Oratosquilla oratoria TaxID=337810 RepID=UPI003F75867C